MSDKGIMLLVAFVSVIMVIWAFFVPAHGVAVALILNALISVYLAFKFGKDNNK